MSTLLLCSAVLILLLGALGLNVSRLRRKGRKFQEIDTIKLDKAIRAHGNASEYAPIFVSVFLYIDTIRLDPNGYIIGLALLATASRFAHAVGMLRAASATAQQPLRTYGAFGTYVSLLGLSGVLLARALQL